MKLYLIFSLFLIVFVSNSYSQLNYSFRCEVIDDSDSLVWGNILVLNVSDNSLIKGNYFDEGKAIVEEIESSNVLIKIRARGYYDTTFVIENFEGINIDFGRVILRRVVLDVEGVNVVYKVPLFEPTSDGSVKINVQKTMLSTSTSIFEMLAKCPNVIVRNGSVSVVGKGAALIYLDGKRIPTDQLNSIQVGTIDEVIVITSPSAKYDADGQAILNIITIPNHSEGVQGTIIENFTWAKHPLSSTSLLLSYRKNKLSFSAEYGLNLGKDWSLSNTEQILDTDLGIYNSKINSESNPKMTFNSNYRFGVGYQLNPESDISAEYNGYYNLGDLDTKTENQMTAPFGEIRVLDTENKGRTIALNHSVSLNYNKVLDTLGSAFFAGGRFSVYDNSLIDEIFEEITIDNILVSKADRNNISSNNIIVATPQVDFTKAFLKGGTLELGAKYSYASNQGRVNFFSKPVGETEFVEDPAYENNFVYSENIPAVYSQYSGVLGKKLNYKIGARSEYTMAFGKSNVTNTTLIDSSYLSVFPNLGINSWVTEKWNLGLTYTSSISRPQYQDLDPYVLYVDSLTSRQGNPFLVPVKIHSLQGVAIYKTYSLTAGYTYSTNAFRFAILPGNTGVNSIVLKQINVQQLHSYSITLGVPVGYKFWSAYNVINVTANKIVDNRPEFIFQAVKPQVYLYSYHSFAFKKLFNFEIIGEYIGAQNDGIYNINAMGTLTIGLSRSFFKESLKCSFSANDVLRTYREVGSFAVGQTSINFNEKLNTNFYRLSLVFSFGKLRDIIYNNRKIGDEETGRVKQ